MLARAHGWRPAAAPMRQEDQWHRNRLGPRTEPTAPEGGLKRASELADGCNDRFAFRALPYRSPVHDGRLEGMRVGMLGAVRPRDGPTRIPEFVDHELLHLVREFRGAVGRSGFVVPMNARSASRRAINHHDDTQRREWPR